MVSARVVNGAPPTGNITTAYSLSLLSEYTHTLDSLPLDLSRNFADLRELDAVLSSSMSSITSKIHKLTHMIEHGSAAKEERLWLLTEIADEAARLKLGGEDKIRVACQAADNLKHNLAHLKNLGENVPGFDATMLIRKTTYPHVSARSFMPAMSSETGRRRRGGFSTATANMPDQSPAKRKRVVRDDDLDLPSGRSPRKDKHVDGNARSRARVRNSNRNERAVSPSESLVSVTSHNFPQTGHNNSEAHQRSTAANARSNASNKRARSNVTNRLPSPSPADPPYATSAAPHDHQINSHHQNPNSHRDATYNFPPSSLHPSLPLPYQSNPAVNGISGTGHHPSPFDLHVMPPSLAANGSDWMPPLAQQLEGPGMPVSRAQSIHPVHSNIPIAPLGATNPATDSADAGDGDGDGDEKTYCFCDGVSYGQMIACDDRECEREWFHLTCIGLTGVPPGLWFCDTCRAKRNAKRSGRGGKRRATGGRAGGRAS